MKDTSGYFEIARALVGTYRAPSISDAEGIQLSPALRQAISAGDSLENIASGTTRVMQVMTEFLQSASTALILDSTNEVARLQMENTWDSLYRLSAGAQIWADVDDPKPKLQAMISRYPVFDRFKTQIEETLACIEALPIKPKGEASPLQEVLFRGFWPPGAPDATEDAMKEQYRAAIRTVAEVEKRFGSFCTWRTRPCWTKCESLMRH